MLYLLVACLLFCLGGTAAAEDAEVFDAQVLDGAVSTPAGRVFVADGGVVLGIGGLDADGNPMAEVEIVATGEDGTVEVSRAELSRPLAFAAATSHAGKVYVLGGLGVDGPTERVFSLRRENGDLIEEELPSLPSARLLAGAAIHRSTTRYFLYSIGGTPSLDRPEASAEVFEILVDGVALDSELQWNAKPDMPQGGRIAPMATEAFNEIVVAGGYLVDGDGGLVPSDDVWGYARVPRDGHDEPGWRQRKLLPTALAQAAFSRSGQSHVIFVGGDADGGGVDEVFGSVPSGGLADGVLGYHALTDTWIDLGRMATPSLGGTLAATNDNSFFFAGVREGHGDALPPAEITFKRSTRHLQWLDYAVIVLFFAVMIGQGVWFAVKKKTAETYSVGGGTMKWWATAMSLAATGVSSISFLAVPALVASVGPVAMAGMVMLIPATLVSAYVTFPLLRRLQVISIYEYLERRFGAPLRFFGSFNSIVTLIMGRIGLVILLPSLAISSMTGLDPVVSILAIGLVTTIYSSAGGFEAVVWTDVLQGLMLFGGFFLLGILAFQGVPDGFRGLFDTASALERDTMFLLSPDPKVYSFWFVLLGSLMSIMSSLSDQQAAQRVIATPLKDVRRFAFSFGAFSLLVSLLSLFIGLCLLAYFRANPQELSPVMKNEQMVPLFMVQNMPVGVAGFILAAIFAASMSTVSSGVNSCAVLVAEDFYRRLFKNSTRKTELRIMKIGTLVVGLVGTAAALWLLSLPMPTLWETFSRIMALLAGGFGGVFILGFFTRRTNLVGAIAGVLVSATVAFLIQFGSFDLHWSTLGIFIVMSCVVTGYVTSLLVPCKPRDLTGLTVWNLVKAQVTDEELEAKTRKEAEAAR